MLYLCACLSVGDVFMVMFKKVGVLLFLMVLFCVAVFGATTWIRDTTSDFVNLNVSGQLCFDTLDCQSSWPVTLSFVQIVAGIGNWSLDKSSYNTIVNDVVQDNLLVSANGNFSANNASLWSNISNNRIAINNLQVYNTSLNAQVSSLSNLSMTQIFTGLGNFSANNASIQTRLSDLSSANTSINNKVSSLVNLTMNQAFLGLGNFSANNASIQTRLSDLSSANTTINTSLTNHLSINHALFIVNTSNIAMANASFSSNVSASANFYVTNCIVFSSGGMICNGI